MRTYAPLAFNCTPEENKEFHDEAKRLGINLIELFRRMFKTWKTVTTEEEKRKKGVLIGFLKSQNNNGLTTEEKKGKKDVLATLANPKLNRGKEK